MSDHNCLSGIIKDIDELKDQLTKEKQRREDAEKALGEIIETKDHAPDCSKWVRYNTAYMRLIARKHFEKYKDENE